MSTTRDHFISKLVDETLEGIDPESPEIHQTELENYFENKLSNPNLDNPMDNFYRLAGENSLFYYLGYFENSNSCFRFSIGKSILDFPSNWSVFEMIRSKVREAQGEIFGVEINKFLDHDKLIEVFQNFNQKCSRIFFICYNKNITIFTFNEDQDHVVEKFLKVLHDLALIRKQNAA